MAPITRKTCTDLLQEELKTPIKTNQRAWRFMERLGVCFVSLANDVLQIGLHLYGNGVPGGLTVKVDQLASHQQAMHEAIQRIENLLEKDKQITYGRRSDDLPTTGKPDTFDSLLRWLWEKVAPALVVGFVFFIINVFVFFAAVLLMLGQGWLSFP